MRIHGFLFLAVVLSRVSLLAQSTDVSQLSPFLNTYCIGCHNQTRKVGGLMLDTLRVGDVSMDAEVWEKVLRELRAHTMPVPFATRRPDDKAYAAAISTLAAALDQATLRHSSPPLPRLSDPEWASRLARFLWNGIPDKQLRDAKLTGPGVLEQQVRRMLKDPKAKAFVEGFMKKALAVEGFPQHERLNSALVESFRRETELFLAYQLHEDRPIMEIWTANYSFLNEALARHYGVPKVSGAAFRRVVLKDNARQGLLGQGSFLTNTATLERTAPSVRGTWMLHNFFGVGTPTPPPNMDPITITQSATELHVPRGRVWTYHLYRWGDRFEGPGGTKQVQARFDGDKLIVVAAPSVRAGAVLEVWSLSADGNQLTVDSVNMSEVTIYFDFKESSISPAYARNRTTYTRAN